MTRVYNFSAGPAALPEEVLKKAASELVEYENSGMSVMEMSHRSKAYLKIYDGAVAALKDIMNIPDNYKILFLQGGASSQFAMVPLNLAKNKKCDLVHTGQWTKKALTEAKDTSMLMFLLLLKIRHSLISLNSIKAHSVLMQTIFIFVQITQYMEQDLLHFQIQEMFHWLLICLHIFSQRLWM